MGPEIEGGSGDNAGGGEGLRLRRSRLFIPGNNPRMIQTAKVFAPDMIILDLEDSVAPENKDEARILVKNALGHVDLGNSEITVRVNPLDEGGYEDLKIINEKVNAVVMPKVEGAGDVEAMANALQGIEDPMDRLGDIGIIATIESAKGILNAPEIVKAPRVSALAFGAEDYTRDIGGERTKEGYETLFARSMIVAAAKSAGIQALDTVYSDVNDLEGLYEDTLRSRKMGFDGRSAIHPSQVEVIHRAYTPSRDEVEWAKRVIDALEDGKKSGTGAVSLDGRMIDRPVAKRAERIITLAKAAGVFMEE